MSHYSIKYKPGYRANQDFYTEEYDKRVLERKLARQRDYEQMQKKNAERKAAAEERKRLAAEQASNNVEVEQE